MCKLLDLDQKSLRTSLLNGVQIPDVSIALKIGFKNYTKTDLSITLPLNLHEIPPYLCIALLRVTISWVLLPSFCIYRLANQMPELELLLG